MIVDSRHIMFSPEAVREAVKIYRAQFPQKQPPGQLGAIFIRQAHPLVLGIQILAPGARHYREVAMAESEAAAMLILYCRAMRIPLARAASKAITAEGDHLLLRVTKAIPIRPTTG